ncbi:MAG: disulfide bond formation protein B [Pseudomonadota bacterium]
MHLNKVFNQIIQDGFKLVGFMSFLALCGAYFSEILWQLEPCILCIYQRIPYFLIIIISALKFPRSRKYLSFLIIIFLFIEIGLAFYHLGIERHVFNESSICNTDLNISSALSTTKLASSCSLAEFKFMNLSMAEWNFIYAFSMIYYFIKKEGKNGLFTWR